jgi:hypothetical protein
MVSEGTADEWTDDTRQPKNSTEHAEQLRAVLKARDLS